MVNKQGYITSGVTTGTPTLKSWGLLFPLELTVLSY